MGGVDFPTQFPMGPICEAEDHDSPQGVMTSSSMGEAADPEAAFPRKQAGVAGVVGVAASAFEELPPSEARFLASLLR